MDEFINEPILKLRTIADEVSIDSIAPLSAKTDMEASWPKHSFDALAGAGLLGLHVPKYYGGHEQGLLALATISETIAKYCASSAICYAMHCVGSAVIAAKATKYHEENYLVPIAENQHVTTLALSESGTGAHFYLPQTQLVQDGAQFTISGKKQFVTNGSHADSYVISTRISNVNYDTGEFNCFVVDANTPGLTWGEPWQGFGMRGNSSRSLDINNVRVSKNNLLGDEGDQIWYIFEVVAPYFLIAMAATYVGIAQSALEISLNHLQRRSYSHSGTKLADVQPLQMRIAEMAMAVNKSRALLYRAAYLGDIGDHEAISAIMMAKIDAAELSVKTTNEAMTLCGGTAYRENSELSRLLRDARASHVMSPTTDMLKTWSGRILLGLPFI